MPDLDDTELPRGLALAWGVAATPQRGPKREMSIERIVEAAIEIADADGLGAVSMSAVATRLGFTPMSLYRYVTAKDDLILLMQEEATGLPPEAINEHDGWRARLLALFRAQLDAHRAHPWVLDIPITGAPVTPNSAAYMDLSFRALEDTSLTPAERLGVTLLITGHARWYGTIIAAYARAARESGYTDEQISALENGLFDTLVTAEEYPALRRAVDAGVFRSSEDPFAFGIDRILDGIAAFIAQRDAGEQTAPPPEWDEPDPPAVLEDKRLREARKAVQRAEKELRDARKHERQALRDARERAARG